MGGSGLVLRLGRGLGRRPKGLGRGNQAVQAVIVVAGWKPTKAPSRALPQVPEILSPCSPHPSQGSRGSAGPRHGSAPSDQPPAARTGSPAGTSPASREVSRHAE